MYDHNKVEKEIVEFWKKSSIYSKNKEKNKGKKPFYFLQGPPYTSGRLHIAHAWNNAIKDFVLRYKRMRNYDVWDRAGYDMHGLPTSSKVQQKLGLKSKEDIEKYGMDKFVKECISFSKEHAEIMSAGKENIVFLCDHVDDIDMTQIRDEAHRTVVWFNPGDEIPDNVIDVGIRGNLQHLADQLK